MIGKDSIGRITKQRSGFIKKCISDATNFCIQFPMDMDVNMKAVLLGACLLIVSIKQMTLVIHRTCKYWKFIFRADIFNCLGN